MTTILVVDDCIPVQDLLCELLRTDDYEVVSADSAETAIHILTTLTEPPALIISDLRLGNGMGGAELLRRAASLCPGIKGILMSGASQEAAANRTFSFLAKPFNPEALLSLVARVLAAENVPL
jgi:DNA-binding NtrC family response regulator